MWRRTAIAGLALLLGVAVVLTSADGASPPFSVTSTLDGKTVLPARIHWIAHTSLPQSQLKSGGVGFLIDNKNVWNGQTLPVTFGDDGGYLVTSWLTPGTHSFTTRVWRKDRVKVDDTVVARVLPAPAPPAALAGTWQRTINTTAAPKAGSTGNPTNTFTPSGTYKLIFDKRWIQARFPGTYVPKTSAKTGAGFILDNDWTPGTKSFHLFGGVTFKVLQDIDAEGGWWCYPGGPEADYSWSVTGDTLTLTPVGGADACGIRGFIWAGQWTRAH